MDREEQSKEYNEYMTKLFRDCSVIATTEAYKLSKEPKALMTEMFNNASSMYNNQIAAEFINELKILCAVFEIERFPAMFWKTPEGKATIEEIIHTGAKLIENEVNTIIREYDNSGAEKELLLRKNDNLVLKLEETIENVSGLYIKLVDIEPTFKTNTDNVIRGLRDNIHSPLKAVKIGIEIDLLKLMSDYIYKTRNSYDQYENGSSIRHNIQTIREQSASGYSSGNKHTM